MIKRNKSIVTDNIILVCFFLIFLSVSIARHYDSPRSVINSDPEGYYMYLPAVFVYGNIHQLPDMQFVGSIKNEKGETYTKYTYGIALFYLPFFLIAHLYAHIFHIDASGFTPPYCYAMVVGGVFWAFVGLFLFKALLLRYFNRLTSWLTLLCVMLGTNFYNYATLEMGMSHVYNFALFAAIILVTDNYYKTPTKGKAMLLGLLLGWIVLARPTNIVMMIFLIFFNIVSSKDIKERAKFIKMHIGQLCLGVPFFVLMLIPQLLYWKEMAGTWVKYSYENEHFIFWKHPKILAVLFDTQNGLLLYSPILLFLFWALVMKRKDPRTNFIGVTTVFAIITYIFASWWAWFFGGAFGHRCYIEYYIIFGFPLAATLEHIVGLKNYLFKAPLIIIIILFCYYSVALSSIYHTTAGIWEGPDWRWSYDRWWGLVRRVF